MEIKISAVHFELTEAIKNFVHEKFKPLLPRLVSLDQIEIVLISEKHGFTTKINAPFAPQAVIVEATNIKDMYQSITEAVATFQDNLNRIKRKPRD